MRFYHCAHKGGSTATQSAGGQSMNIVETVGISSREERPGASVREKRRAHAFRSGREQGGLAGMGLGVKCGGRLGGRRACTRVRAAVGGRGPQSQELGAWYQGDSNDTGPAKNGGTSAAMNGTGGRGVEVGAANAAVHSCVEEACGQRCGARGGPVAVRRRLGPGATMKGAGEVRAGKK